MATGQKPTLTAVKSAQDIIGTKKAGKAIEEIFNVIHPAPARTSLDQIFTQESAGQFLDRVTSFSKLLSQEQTYDQALAALDSAIEQAEGVRDQVMAELYRQIRPVERSLRSSSSSVSETEATLCAGTSNCSRKSTASVSQGEANQPTPRSRACRSIAAYSSDPNSTRCR